MMRRALRLASGAHRDLAWSLADRVYGTLLTRFLNKYLLTLSGIEIVELAEVSEKKRIAVTGFAGAGSIGNTAIMHGVRSEGYRQVAYVHGDLMPPLMILVQGQPRHGFRVYADGKDEHLFMVTEALLSSESAWAVGKKLVAWLGEKGLDEIIALEGFPFAQAGGNVFGFTTGSRDLQGCGVQPISEGAISGVNASLLEEAMKRRVDWTTVFVPTQVIGGIDYRGAADALQVLNRMLGLGVDTERLHAMSETMARAARTMQRQQRKGGLLGRILPGEPSG
jgi:predicted ATP-grasp superfamily ATP-dependent carboligase